MSEEKAQKYLTELVDAIRVRWKTQNRAYEEWMASKDADDPERHDAAWERYEDANEDLREHAYADVDVLLVLREMDRQQIAALEVERDKLQRKLSDQETQTMLARDDAKTARALHKMAVESIGKLERENNTLKNAGVTLLDERDALKAREREAGELLAEMTDDLEHQCDMNLITLGAERIRRLIMNASVWLANGEE